MNMISFGEVKIMPFQEATVLYFSLNQKVNEHTVLEFRLLLPEEKKDSYIERITAEEKIALVVKKDEKEDKIFYGKTLYMEIETGANVYELRGKAVSYTKDIDIKIKSRSFQNKDETYAKLAKGIVGEYQKADFEDNIFLSNKTGKFILQYQESDWEFLKRMASRYNAPLIPIATREAPVFSIGINKNWKEIELNTINYKVKKI